MSFGQFEIPITGLNRLQHEAYIYIQSSFTKLLTFFQRRGATSRKSCKEYLNHGIRTDNRVHEEQIRQLQINRGSCRNQ